MWYLVFRHFELGKKRHCVGTLVIVLLLFGKKEKILKAHDQVKECKD